MTLVKTLDNPEACRLMADALRKLAERFESGGVRLVSSSSGCEFECDEVHVHHNVGRFVHTVEIVFETRGTKLTGF